MKLTLIIALIGILLIGCVPTEQKPTIMSTVELAITDADLEGTGIKHTACEHPVNEYTPIPRYGLCNYTIDRLPDTEVVTQLYLLENLNDRNGLFDYESLHLRGLQGIIAENEYGDRSRFYVNNESTIYYYHLWIAKDLAVIHVTSKGSEDAKQDILTIGERSLAKIA